jgi:diadenosine tetraphosphate (Ap4A) HIT family hydrolase
MSIQQENITSNSSNKQFSFFTKILSGISNNGFKVIYPILYFVSSVYVRVHELVFPKKTPPLLDGETYRNGVSYHPGGKIKRCLFCEIIEEREYAIFVETTDHRFKVFKTIDPASSNHLLVVPKNHIRSIKELEGKTGAALIESMREVGRKALGVDAVDAQFCFHVPPNTSIDHLHMHAIGNKSSMGFWNWFKYLPDSSWCWTAQTVIERLKNADTCDKTPLKSE